MRREILRVQDLTQLELIFYATWEDGFLSEEPSIEDRRNPLKVIIPWNR